MVIAATAAKLLQLCVTPYTAAHQAPLSLGFSRQEHWSGLPFPSPMHESEKWKGSRSVVPDSQRPHGLQPTRLLHPWDFPGKSTGVGCHCLLRKWSLWRSKRSQGTHKWETPSGIKAFQSSESRSTMAGRSPGGLHVYNPAPEIYT